MKITRRRFLGLIGAVAASAVLGYLGFNYLFPRKRRLKVYNYSYYIDPKVIDKFEKLYNVEVIYNEYEAAEEALAKIQLGGGGSTFRSTPSSATTFSNLLTIPSSLSSSPFFISEG